ncbi:MAG: hypothetical protein ACLFQV_13705 [Vulcanimicrobiota bacterium]
METALDETYDILEGIIASTTDEEFITTNFINIKDLVLDYLDKLIEINELNEALEEMLEIINETRNNYEQIYIGKEEWTLEVSLGDRLLIEGIVAWEEALKQLKKGAENSNDNLLLEGIDRAFEANKTLALVQLLAEQVNKQAEEKRI